MTLEEMIRNVAALERLPERTAAIAAEKLGELVARTAAAGTSPDGEAWAPRKEGGRAMVNAAAHVSARAYGDVVRITLRGPDVFHQFGTRGEPRRAVIPESGAAMPASVAQVLEQASRQAFEEITSGVRR